MNNFLSDIATLAKAGYTVSDVKDIIAMSKENAATMPKDKEPETSEPDKGTDAPGSSDISDGRSYKELYEETKTRLDALQSANTKKEVEEPDITIDSIVTDLSAFIK